MTDNELSVLMEKARSIEMTPEQQEAQRRSFAYGSAHIENEDVTRELIDSVASARPVNFSAMRSAR